MKRTSIVCRIPKELNDKLNGDPFYQRCCLEDETCSGRIERHHNLIWQGSRQNHDFCILPLCQLHHKNEKRRDIKEQLDLLMYMRMTKEQLRFYSKAINLEQRKKYLLTKYPQ